MLDPITFSIFLSRCRKCTQPRRRPSTPIARSLRALRATLHLVIQESQQILRHGPVGHEWVTVASSALLRLFQAPRAGRLGATARFQVRVFLPKWAAASTDAN